VTLAPSVPPAPRASDESSGREKDLPLRDDTRLLGRLLGDVLREQCGVAGFERVEAVRQTAVRFRRAGLRDAPAVKAELAHLLNDLPIGETLNVVRAFSYFSHLANLAEDVHQNRRRRAHALAGSPPQRGSLADALDQLAAHRVSGDALIAWFADALLSPVLTAHPTEVQRRSILDCEREIVRLLQWRDRGTLAPDEAAEFETGLYRQVLALWQTAMIRLHKLKVRDEIDNGPRLLSLHVPRRGAEALPRARVAARVRVRRRAARCAAAVPAARLVDRRRP
jgi:phosphoenolpyruvate carboxylase